MDDGTAEEPEPLNPYLALRETKIARNNARLRELGLLKEAPPTRIPTPRSTNNAAKASTARSLRSNANNRIPLRRSTRLKYSPVSIFKGEKVLDQTLDPPGPRKRPKTVSPQSTTSTAPPQVYPPHSARSMTLNVTQLLHGTNETPGLLGRHMTHTGKQHVMLESARLAAVAPGVHGGNGVIQTISFNKYSGVQEWGNDVLFLWVNLNAPESDVVNEFLDNGRKVTWFGGSRMHDGSAVIQKIVQVGSSKDVAESPSKGVILWCRQYLPHEKTFSSYVCLGRLSLVFYDPYSQPLSFVWNLLDADLIAKSEDKIVRDNFRRMCQGS